MKKNSSFERVVGDISQSEKEQFLRDKGERFDDQVFEDLKGKEREKTSEEVQMISLANEATNEVRRRYGLEKFNIPPENIHVISEEMWPKEKSTAFFNSMLQGVAMREKMSNLAFIKSVFHDMLHFKSYNAAQFTTGKDSEFEEYRLGLTVHTRDGKRTYFVNLNEAVTEEITKRFVKKLINHSLFAEEIDKTRDVMAKHSHATTDSGDPLFDEDTFYAEAQSKKSWRESVDRLIGRKIFGSSATEVSTETFTYRSERKILNTLIEKILEKDRDTFRDREEIFEVFAKGMMTGNILPVGRLIDGTFGRGTLRRIGELDQDLHAQEKFVNSL